MLKKRIIITLTFLDGILFRTKKFKPDYRYTKNFVDLWTIDELILIDLSNNKFSKKFLNLVNFFSSNCFVPITVGGGIRSLEDADLYFKYGSDKILLGSNVITNPNLITQISKKYGNQSIVQSLDCEKTLNSSIYTVKGKSGNKDLKISPIEFGKISLSYGAGEILINNIDNDGSLLGYDLDLINQVTKKLDCPILALGGAGNWQHFLDLFSKTMVSAACTQNIFHFTNESVKSLKNFLTKHKINIRK